MSGSTSTRLKGGRLTGTSSRLSWLSIPCAGSLPWSPGGETNDAEERGRKDRAAGHRQETVSLYRLWIVQCLSGGHSIFRLSGPAGCPRDPCDQAVDAVDCA